MIKSTFYNLNDLYIVNDTDKEVIEQPKGSTLRYGQIKTLQFERIPPKTSKPRTATQAEAELFVRFVNINDIELIPE